MRRSFTSSPVRCVCPKLRFLHKPMTAVATHPCTFSYHFIAIGASLGLIRFNLWRYLVTKVIECRYEFGGFFLRHVWKSYFVLPPLSSNFAVCQNRNSCTEKTLINTCTINCIDWHLSKYPRGQTFSDNIQNSTVCNSEISPCGSQDTLTMSQGQNLFVWLQMFGQDSRNCHRRKFIRCSKQQKNGA